MLQPQPLSINCLTHCRRLSICRLQSLDREFSPCPFNVFAGTSISLGCQKHLIVSLCVLLCPLFWKGGVPFRSLIPLSFPVTAIPSRVARFSPEAAPPHTDNLWLQTGSPISTEQNSSKTDEGNQKSTPKASVAKRGKKAGSIRPSDRTAKRLLIFSVVSSIQPGNLEGC